MEHYITEFIDGKSMLVLLGIIAVCLFLLGYGADLLVEEAVALSTRLGISKVLIGATIVSLGTTLPEVTVSIFSALNGHAEIALGNAIGSIICDSGLILGIAALMKPLPIERSLVNRQGYFQLGSGILLVVACLPFSNLGSTFETGGNMSQIAGFIFLAILGVYLWLSVKWAKTAKSPELPEDHEKGGGLAIFLKILLGLTLIIIASHILIPNVQEIAIRVGIPDSVIAATLVAFGTSLPELVTVVTAVRKGHGELAIGNIIGADILNALFVAGAAAAVTTTGLTADPNTFKVLFPCMIGILVLFRICTSLSKKNLGRTSGAALLLSYLVYLYISL